jgi:hypothetical protein
MSVQRYSSAGFGLKEMDWRRVASGYVAKSNSCLGNMFS